MADLPAQPPSGQAEDWITVEITEALGSTRADAEPACGSVKTP